MTEAEVLDVAREAIWVTLSISLPLLMVALVTGLIVSLFQALTQIQEMTLAFVPKIIFVFLFFLTPLFSMAEEHPTKLILDEELINQYLPSLQDSLGSCLDESCLSTKNGYKVLNLKDKSNICFPGTDCEFYNCMEDKFRCDSVSYPYFKHLAYPTCSAYVKRIQQKKFTKKGVDWIYRVMVCLQKGLVQECDVENNCQQAQRSDQCHHITEYTLSFHPGCYLESGVGICSLPIKDQLAIWKTVRPFLTDREKKEAYIVMKKCLLGYRKSKTSDNIY